MLINGLFVDKCQQDYDVGKLVHLAGDGRTLGESGGADSAEANDIERKRRGVDHSG